MHKSASYVYSLHTHTHVSTRLRFDNQGWIHVHRQHNYGESLLLASFLIVKVACFYYIN